MKDKVLGYGLLAVVGAAIFAGIFEGEMSLAMSDGIYMVAGVAMLVLGTWGGVRLIKLDERKEEGK